MFRVLIKPISDFWHRIAPVSVKLANVDSCEGFTMSNDAARIADALYNSGRLKFESFKIKSGALSPYYIDLACLLSTPRELCTIADIVADKIKTIWLLTKLTDLPQLS